MEQIRLTYENLDKRAFMLAVQMICRARHIYIMGVRDSMPMAAFLSSQLALVSDNLHFLNSSGSRELLEQMPYIPDPEQQILLSFHIGERDVIIGISFPPYSIRTLKALEFASERKASVITISDDAMAPIHLYSSCKLIAGIGAAQTPYSLAAPMSLMYLLAREICRKKRKKVARTLEQMEYVREKYQVFDRDGMDFFPFPKKE